jgi:nucleoside-diphosphate-sugar epimerase
MHNFLVTGGAGFLGSNLVHRLMSDSLHVDIVDDLSNGHLAFVPESLKNDNVWLSDFSSQIVLDRIRSKYYDYVIHLAANPRVSYSVEHPIETNETNVTKTLKLIDACRGNVKRFVFASSCEVYGQTEFLPTTENNLHIPESPYGLQKSIIEGYLRLYSRLHGLDSVCLRFFNLFGPNQLGNSPYSTAVSAWLTAIKSNMPMRSDGDGKQTRDMCFVEDAVEALVAAALVESPLNGEAFNIASGVGTSNIEIMNYLKSKYPQAKSYSVPPRAGDVKHTLADISRSFTKLNFAPRVSLREGIDKTANWYDENWDQIQKDM